MGWGRRRATRLLMVVVALLGLALTGAAPSQASHGTGSISGRVTDHLGNPIAGTCVEAQSDSEYQIWQTAADGSYTINGLPAGSYRVSFACWGDDWVREAYDDALSWWQAGRPVDVAEGEAVTSIDADLVRGATLSGRVVDAGGNPVEDGWVNVWATDEPSRSVGSGGWVNPDGTFTVHKIPPGVFKLNVGLPGDSASAWPPGDGLVVASGDIITDITLAAASSTSAAVSGRVTDTNGAPLDGACIVVRPKHSPGASAWSTTDAAGDWQASVREGRYTLYAYDCTGQNRFASTYLGGTSRAEAAEFDVVGSAPVTGLDIAARRGGTISGRLTDVAGAPVVGACMSASPTVPDYDTYGPSSRKTDADGRYTLAALSPGDHIVYAYPCTDPEQFVGQPYGGEAGPRIDGTPIPVADEAVVTGIDFSVHPPARLEGTARNALGEPLASVCVELEWADSGEITLGNGVTDAEGRYRISGLPGWDVKARYSDCSFQQPRRVSPEYWQDAATFETATSIPLTLGQTTPGIDPVLDPIAFGGVSGMVREGGVGVEDACVVLVDSQGRSVSARTDASGHYAASDVEPGEYTATVADCFNGNRFGRQVRPEPVTVGPGQFVTGVDFDVADFFPKPTTTGVKPASGSAAGGTVVSIVGRDLKGVTEVRFGDQPAPSLVGVSRNQVDAVAPPGTAGTTVDVVAIGPGGASTPVALTRFTYTSAPTLAGITPDRGPLEGGNEVRITGGLLSGATAVRFGGVDAPAFTVESDHAIVATVPAGAQAGEAPVEVTTPGGTTVEHVVYRYEAPLPVVASVSPPAGPLDGGQWVTITGTRLSDVSEVAFGSQSTWFTVIDDGRVEAYVPWSDAAGFVDVRVTSPLGVSQPHDGARYEYVAAPQLTDITPSHGPEAGGGTATATGAGLDRVTELFVGGSSVPFTAMSPTWIEFTMPPGWGRTTVAVRSVGGHSNSLTYTYVPAPSISAVSPGRGSLDGGAVTVSGWALEHTDHVTVDGFTTPFGVQPDGSLVVSMPPHARGTATIQVVSPGGTATGSYRYVDRPRITAVSPPQGSALGGTVVLSGVDLVDVQKVEMSEPRPLLGPVATPVVFTANPDETITVEMPPRLPGTVFLTVTTKWGVSEAGEGRYEYTAGLR